MAKGVVFGVIGCVTTLPALILTSDRLLEKTKHRPLVPKTDKIAAFITNRSWIFLIIFAVIIVPAYIGNAKTNDEVYYDLGNSLPKDMQYAIANSKLKDKFDVASTHMALVSADVPSKDVKAMMKEMESVDGVKYVLGMDSGVGSLVPEDVIPKSITSILKSDKWELLLVNSEYKTASDAVNHQLDELSAILKKYDKSAMLIGEASCTKDMIEVTDHDFQVVDFISIIAVFIIIALVLKSASLPVILVSVIEFAIFINLGLPHYTNTSLPFVAPICISTIQLGSTIDYAILMTTRYQRERSGGQDKRGSITKALEMSIPSIMVSAIGFFAATFGVAAYSNIDIISSVLPAPINPAKPSISPE
jgi:predicted RND superfamily exporter protein